VISNGTADVEVLVTSVVKNDDGTLTRTPVKDSWVELDTTNGTLNRYNGTTDSQGKFRTTFDAPYVPPTDEYVKNGSKILLEIKDATLEDYDAAPSKLSLLTVYPEGVPFLAVQMEADPDVIDDKDETGAAGLTSIVVTVTDQDNNPVADTNVIIKVDPNEPEITPATGLSDSNGRVTFSFTAVDIEEDKEYTTSVIAAKEGFKNGTQSMPINVINFETTVVTTETPFPSFLIVTAVFCVAAVSYSVFRRLRA
jgi:hypothetical protein